MAQALAPLNLATYKEDFYESEEGKLWYDCNVPKPYISLRSDRILNGGVRKRPKKIRVIGGPPRRTIKFG